MCGDGGEGDGNGGGQSTGGMVGPGQPGAESPGAPGLGAGSVGQGPSNGTALGGMIGPGHPGAESPASAPDGFGVGPQGGAFGSPVMAAIQANNIPAAATIGLANAVVPGVGMVGMLGNALGAQPSTPDGQMSPGHAGPGTGSGMGGEGGGLVRPAPKAPTPAHTALAQALQGPTSPMQGPGYTHARKGLVIY